MSENNSETEGQPLEDQSDAVLADAGGAAEDAANDGRSNKQAMIDEEGDIAADALAQARTAATVVAARIAAELTRPPLSERVRDGFVVAVPPDTELGEATEHGATVRAKDLHLFDAASGRRL